MFAEPWDSIKGIEIERPAFNPQTIVFCWAADVEGIAVTQRTGGPGELRLLTQCGETTACDQITQANF